MAYSVDDYYKRLYKTGEKELKDSEQVYRTEADAAIKAQKEAYAKQMSDVQEGYDSALKRNEIQRVLNERYLERKAAEMGLTDSGMNRTQITANQLSYANQKGTLDANMQKDINTLAAAMNAKISEIETTRDANISNARNTYSANIRNAAIEARNKDLEYESESTKQKNQIMQERAKTYNELIKNLSNDDLSVDEKLALFTSYNDAYGFSSQELANMALKSAGIEGTIDNNGVLSLNSDMESFSNGNYTIVKSKNTRNGFLGLGNIVGRIDKDDTYQIFDEKGNLIATIDNIDKFTSLSKSQKKKLSQMKENDSLEINNLIKTDVALKRFIDSLK